MLPLVIRGDPNTIQEINNNPEYQEALSNILKRKIYGHWKLLNIIN